VSTKGAFFGLRPSGGGVELTLFGFPTRIQASFLVVAALLGLYPGATVRSVITWTVIVAASVTWHELGHAFAARRLGAAPTIDLYSFGGLTHWSPAHDASRWEMISVAAAGPGAGLLLALPVALYAWSSGGFDDNHITFFLLWVNVGWGLVNLLPVLPLDGGHILAQLLPGDRDLRHRRAAVVSIVIGSIAAAALISIGYYWGALIFGWAIATNITALRAPAIEEKARALDGELRETLNGIGTRVPGSVERAIALQRQLGPRGPAFKVVAVEAAAAAGDARGARQLMDDLQGQLPPALYALVDVVETAGLHGLDELGEIFARDPLPAQARWLVLGLHRAGRMDDLLGLVHQVPSPRRTAELIEAMVGIVAWADRPDLAADLRLLAVG
jgi:stage IV sporulation protein FB